MRKRVSAAFSIFIFSFALLFSQFQAVADTGRWEYKISGQEWKLWLDRDAEWLEDDIYMPPVNIASLPVNPPTCGWDNLNSIPGKTVTVPGTVEEYYWGANGNPVGIAGDYRGVSWWSTVFTLDRSLTGKRIILAFDSVCLRAEVFVNRKLTGYDVIGNTPFSIDITDAVKLEEENRLDIRITDPVGNFDWSNNNMYRWGNNKVPAYHGFGGITGNIYIRALDAVNIDDIYVQNKPKLKEAEVFIAFANTSGTITNGSVSVVIHEWENPSNVIWNEKVAVSVPVEGKRLSLSVNAPLAQPWNIRDPHLYVASVAFTSDDGECADTMQQRFGFRWFTIGEKDGDERFYLNGERIFVFGPMQRGYWPKNGIFPTPEMAKRNTELLIQLGFNMFIMNQCMVQPYAADICDEYGILTHSDPGGYRCDDQPTDMAKIWRREKLKRMVIRDRSKPSWVVTLLKDETNVEPSDDDIRNMQMVHSLDPTRILVYNSDRNPHIDRFERLEKDPFKLHLRPFDDTLHYRGWWNHHHFIPTAGWQDDYYNNPRFYIRGQVARGDSVHLYGKDEIIWLGEEGAFGTQLNLGKIKEELDRTGATGWREMEHLDYYKEYDSFLNESGFRSAYPTVEDLTNSMGRNLHYFHGRTLENARISNVVDCYNLNGWASAATHTDLVDQYRNPTADPSILSHYAQPLYVAVKIRDKMLPSGFAPIADLFIINEVDMNGKRTLELELTGPSGESVFSQEYPVTILGGEEFGQLLVEGVQLPTLKMPGYYRLNASIKGNNTVEAAGVDDIFVVDYFTGPGIVGKAAVIDTSGVINTFLEKERRVTLPRFDPSGPDLDLIIVGEHNFNRNGRTYFRAAMDRVANGATLIILDQADRWARMMDDVFSYPALQYSTSYQWGNSGRLFVGNNDILSGLPQAQAMNWEYQVFYKGDVWGIGLGRLGTELIVGLAAQHRKEIISALSRIPFGRGQIFLSTLRIIPELISEKPQSAVAKKLMLNLIELSPEQKF